MLILFDAINLYIHNKSVCLSVGRSVGQSVINIDNVFDCAVRSFPSRINISDCVELVVWWMVVLPPF
jgi:hypothetical protein